MAIRFRKSKSLGKGFRLNVNKNSIGLTGGVQGAHVSVNSKGRVTKSAGIPGTGLSFQSSSGGFQKESGCAGTAVKRIVLLLIIAVFILYAWIPTAVVGAIYFIYCVMTKNVISKKYVTIGALIFAISLGAFIFNKIYIPPSNAQSPQLSSQLSS